jgi:hypothetical protein
MLKEETAHRPMQEVEPRLSSPSASARMTKILEAERWLKDTDLHEAALLQRQQEQGDAGAPHPGAQKAEGRKA